MAIRTTQSSVTRDVWKTGATQYDSQGVKSISNICNKEAYLKIVRTIAGDTYSDQLTAVQVQQAQKVLNIIANMPTKNWTTR